MTPCKYGDPTCPCQDGDPCHYEGENPMNVPPEFVRNTLEKQMTGWQPIETAPKDGTRVMLAYSTGPMPTDWGLEFCLYTEGGKNFCEPGWYVSRYGALDKPIHFEPINWMLVGPPT